MPRWMRAVAFLVLLQVAAASCTRTTVLQHPYADPDEETVKIYRIRLTSGEAYRARLYEVTDSSIVMTSPAGGPYVTLEGTETRVSTLEVALEGVDAVERIESAPMKTTLWIVGIAGVIALLAVGISNMEIDAGGSPPGPGI